MRFFYQKLILPLLLAPILLRAQLPQPLPPGGLIQFQVAQPPIEAASPAAATAAFDPPTAHAGEKVFYRVNVDATEASIQWPDNIPAPAELKFEANAHGQITQYLANKFRSQTSFIYEFQAAAAGRFTVTNFTVTVSGQPMEIPAASLDVITDNSNLPPARQLVLETSATNLFLGQPFHVRVLLPAMDGKQVEGLREVQFNSEGLMTDKTVFHQSIAVANINGQPRPTFICEMTVTPIAAGPLKFLAQGFSAPPFSVGPISITSSGGPITLSGAALPSVFLVSDTVQLNVRPVPLENAPAGFTGAMGKILPDKPQLSTNRMRVGEPVHLKVNFHGDGELSRLVPPVAPRSRDWQIIADKPPASGFTLIPQTDEARTTPVIPFSYFDPATAKFVDLTIPPLPVTVVGESLPVQLTALDDETKSAAPLKLGALSMTPGKTVASLKPLQLQGWFVGVQLVPVVGFLALWQWDRRRRFWEAHPDLLRRRLARHALHREKNLLQKAVVAGDAAAFVQHAADAMRIAVAPHYPANPQALVCADVLAQLDDAERNSSSGETVRKLFAAADARFALTAQVQADLLALNSDMEVVLQRLEAKL